MGQGRDVQAPLDNTEGAFPTLALGIISSKTKAALPTLSKYFKYHLCCAAFFRRLLQLFFVFMNVIIKLAYSTYAHITGGNLYITCSSLVAFVHIKIAYCAKCMMRNFRGSQAWPLFLIFIEKLLADMDLLLFGRSAALSLPVFVSLICHGSGCKTCCKRFVGYMFKLYK